MTRTIHEGDEVTVCWNTDAAEMKGTVLHVPEYPGDLWYIRGHNTGADHAINPMSSDFDCLVKVNPRDEKDGTQ